MSDESMLFDRVPPQDVHAERSVLGSLLRDNGVINDVVQIVRPESFYLDSHQKIYRVICEMYQKAMPVDLVLLADQLRKAKLIEDVGGYKYLAQIWEAVPTAANAEYYARIVRDKSITRGLIHVSTEILKDSYDQVQPSDELLASAERRIMEISSLGVTGQTHDLNEALNQAFDRIDSRMTKSPGQTTGLSTGFSDLDKLTAGLQKSELIILAARPSVGKTAFSLNMIRNFIVEERAACFFVSLEQARVELAERLLCAQARVNSHHLRTGQLNSDELSKLIEAGDTLRNAAKLFIDDTPSQNMIRIASNARRLKKHHDISLVCIDYLQLIEPDNRRDPRHEQVAQISRKLKFLARELEIPVIALAQVNRGSEDRQDHRPRLSDLRESGSIEQDADTCLILHRLEKKDPSQIDDEIEVIIAKQRNGPTGQIMLVYRKAFLRYENYAPDGFGAIAG